MFNLFRRHQTQSDFECQEVLDKYLEDDLDGGDNGGDDPLLTSRSDSSHDGHAADVDVFCALNYWIDPGMAQVPFPDALLDLCIRREKQWQASVQMSTARAAEAITATEPWRRSDTYRPPLTMKEAAFVRELLAAQYPGLRVSPTVPPGYMPLFAGLLVQVEVARQTMLDAHSKGHLALRVGLKFQGMQSPTFFWSDETMPQLEFDETRRQVNLELSALLGPVFTRYNALVGAICPVCAHRADAKAYQQPCGLHHGISRPIDAYVNDGRDDMSEAWRILDEQSVAVEIESQVKSSIHDGGNDEDGCGGEDAAYFTSAADDEASGEDDDGGSGYSPALDEDTSEAIRQGLCVRIFVEPCVWRNMAADIIQKTGSEDIKRMDEDDRRRFNILRQIARLGDDRTLATLPQDWRERMDEFDVRFPNFGPLSELLRNSFALSALGDSRARWPATLLVGEPGIGKTEVANWISDMIGAPMCQIDMASAQTGSPLSGSEEFWSNSRPSRIFNMLALDSYANPVIILDELDKCSGMDKRYDPSAPLHSLLEPRSAREFRDLSIPELRIDASHINWLATANDTRGIPAPILSRLTVLTIQAPTPGQSVAIAQNIYKRLRQDNAWGAKIADHLDASVAHELVVGSPRTLSKTIPLALGFAARQGRNSITLEDARQAIGYTHKSHTRIGFAP